MAETTANAPSAKKLCVGKGPAVAAHVMVFERYDVGSNGASLCKIDGTGVELPNSPPIYAAGKYIALQTGTAALGSIE